MAYETSNPVKRVAGGLNGAPTFWAYEDGDTAATIDGSGYFNAEAARLKVGDWVFVNSGVGGSPAYGIAIVTGNTRDLDASPPVEGVVDITNVVAFGAIDSD